MTTLELADLAGWWGLPGGIASGEAVRYGVVGDVLYGRDALAHKDMHSHGSYLL